MLKSRYCFNPYHGKVGRRMTLLDSFRRYRALKRRAKENHDVVTFTWY